MYLTGLSFTRFIAAIGIVFFHFGNNVPLFKMNLISNFVKYANLGVSYFFLLSGFIMVIAYQKSNFLNSEERKKYWYNRFIRIYPAYFVALFLFIVIGIKFNNLYLSISTLIANLLLLQAWFLELSLSLNFTGWSLSVEMVFYLLFPFLYIRIKKLSNSYLLLLLGFIWLLNSCVHILLLHFENVFSHYFVFYNPLLHLSTFVFGICLGFIYLRNMLPDFLLSKICLSMVLLIVFFLIGSNSFILNYSHNGFLIPLFSVVIVVLANSKNNIINNKFANYLGHISFGIYIYQLPVKTIYIYLFNIDNLNSNTVFLGFIAFLICFSSFSFSFFENPINKFLKENFNKKDI